MANTARCAKIKRCSSAGCSRSSSSGIWITHESRTGSVRKGGRHAAHPRGTPPWQTRGRPMAGTCQAQGRHVADTWRTPGATGEQGGAGASHWMPCSQEGNSENSVGDPRRVQAMSRASQGHLKGRRQGHGMLHSPQMGHVAVPKTKDMSRACQGRVKGMQLRCGMGHKEESSV